MATFHRKKPSEGAPGEQPGKDPDSRTPLPPTPLPQKTLAPTPVRAHQPQLPRGRLRVGFLNWSHIEYIEQSYCADLYLYFKNLAERGEFELVSIGRALKNNSKPFPDLEAVRAAKLDALVSNGIWSHDYLAQVAALSIPVVSVDHDPTGQPFDSVIFDGISAGVVLGKLLLEKKHTDVLFFTRLRFDPAAPRGSDPFIEDPTYMERKMGVQRALVGSDAEFWPVMPLMPGPDEEVGPKVREMFKRITAEMGHWPTIIIAPDVGIAGGAQKVIAEHGLEVPRHISMATFHAQGPSSDTKEITPFSHVTYDWVEMAENAWKMLRARLAGVQAPPKCVRIQARYVDRGSLAERRPEP
ncbi:MAG: LacI family DNA-binding transcriptional regulator [Planctomycetes bacterium]|nr:LacI family DNA-binding transcriptional regulator [Planctomycetota bacterium]